MSHALPPCQEVIHIYFLSLNLQLIVSPQRGNLKHSVFLYFDYEDIMNDSIQSLTEKQQTSYEFLVFIS